MDLRLTTTGSRTFLERRRIAYVALLGSFLAALELAVNRSHNGDVYLLLATGRFIARHGFTWHDPFQTIAAGEPWHNQQWLTEWIFFKVTSVMGMTGLTVFYALILSAGLTMLVWTNRRKSPLAVFLASAVYFFTTWGILHPRGAGISLLAFSALVVLVRRREMWPLVFVPPLFVVWANFHGGFAAGLVFMGAVAAGLGVDWLRGAWANKPGTGIGLKEGRLKRIAVLLIVAAASAGATQLTPLGARILDYFSSFGNPAISLVSTEWESILQSPPAIFLLVCVTALAIWIWREQERRPRESASLIVVAVFVTAAAASMRNILWLAPALFFHVGQCLPDRRYALGRAPLAALGVAATVTLGIFAALGPARTSKHLRPTLADYAAANPPATGRIAAIPGMGSYLLWRSPDTPIVLNGWLEHFSPEELTQTLAILEGRTDAMPYVDRWDIGGVITRSAEGARRLESHGFREKARTEDGIYLVR